MSYRQRSDPGHARYQVQGATVSLQQLLTQRHAAKTLEYLAHSRSIAGISGLHLSRMRGRGIDFEEFRPYQPGDDIKLHLRVDENQRVSAATFLGHGCSISQASVSMMTVRLQGKTLEEALALAERFTEMMHGSSAAARDRKLGELRALQGVSKFPVRIKCALLGFNALEEAVRRVREHPENCS